MSSTEAPNVSATTIISSAIKTIPINKANGIQSGERTHHQDQSILLVSFKTKNTTKSIVGIPKPPLDLLLLAMLIIFRFYLIVALFFLF